MKFLLTNFYAYLSVAHFLEQLSAYIFHIGVKIKRNFLRQYIYTYDTVP